MNEVPRKIVKKVQTLADIASELRHGKHFKITRLTMLKSLCKDEEAAAQFSLHLAKKALQAMKASDGSLPEKKRYQSLASQAVRGISRYLERPSQGAEQSLRQLWSQIRDAQSRYKRQQWGPVRIIESRDLLVVETALECVLKPGASSDLGYRSARQYAEGYNPRYGSGLVPEYASMVEDITEFWGRYFLGRSWRKQLKM